MTDQSRSIGKNTIRKCLVVFEGHFLNAPRHVLGQFYFSPGRVGLFWFGLDLFSLDLVRFGLVWFGLVWSGLV